MSRAKELAEWFLDKHPRHPEGILGWTEMLSKGEPGKVVKGVEFYWREDPNRVYRSWETLGDIVRVAGEVLDERTVG